MKLKNLYKYAIATALILSIPLIAMQFSEEWDWKLFDFVIIGALLMSAGIFYEFVSNKLDKKYRPLLALGVVGGVLLIWAELAVGLLERIFTGA